ncbi:glutaminase (plasmid) [Rhodococcus pyridinivorans SB3094]|uniref:Glutaminase n=1 Tax=Rhodococcus pyridinivorans SB3094 TaxID=1435356 RepID=V9XL06_9NOCA|nr:glutaminase A [Rhodococcus rhodochrous]AHD24136.1 glutaminase [Rhodococcus pyridinivorans SB3094]AYA23262.1 glutaminase A [Rhodococcus rhodochrous]QSE72381.1 glutaminase A [Rhodococcus sp. PSBB049]
MRRRILPSLPGKTRCDISPQLARLETRTDQLQEFVELAAAHGRSAAGTGQVSIQVPALGSVPATKFGMAVATIEGDVLTTGDATEQFSIQSLSKLFALCALLQRDPSAWEHIGWGPTDSGYGSVAELERNHGRPRNPFVNSGALVVTDRLMDLTGDAVGATIDLLTTTSGDTSINSDARVALSESVADHRNAAIAHVLAEHGKLVNGIDRVLTQYFAQCAVAASAQTVAKAALFLADRSAEQEILDGASARRVNAVLLMSGMYGAAGDIAYRIGLPAKSGIGGGVLAIMPGLGTVCVWSPPLDDDGNSAGGVAAIEEFARLAGWSVF